MIDARELRIGNLVNTRRGNQKCIDLLCDCVNFHYLECEPYDLIEPIPLTEEWLKKFGFDKKSDISGYYFIKENHRVYLFPDGKFEFEFNYTDNKRVNLFKLFSYVHQLQNIYFSLTGNELENE